MATKMIRAFAKGALLAAFTSALWGCSDLAPQSTTSTYYAVWDVSGVPLEQIDHTVAASAKERTGSASVFENPPPYPLPARPGRFQVGSRATNQMSGFADMAGSASSSGQLMYALSNITCPGASETVIGKPMDVGNIHVKAVYCVYPYTKGTQVDLAMMYNRMSGILVSPRAAASEIASGVTSAFHIGPKGYMRRAFKNLDEKLQQMGGTVRVTASYLPKGMSFTAATATVSPHG